MPGDADPSQPGRGGAGKRLHGGGDAHCWVWWPAAAKGDQFLLLHPQLSASPVKSPRMPPWLRPLTLISHSTGAGSAQVQEHLGLRLPDHEIRRAPGVSPAAGVGEGRQRGQPQCGRHRGWPGVGRTGGEGAARAPSPTDPPLSPAGFTRAQCLAWAASALTWPSSSSSTTRWSSSSTRCGKRTEGGRAGAAPTTLAPRGCSWRAATKPAAACRRCLGPILPHARTLPPNPATFMFRNRLSSRLNY